MKLVGLRRLAAKKGRHVRDAILREFKGRQFTIAEVAYALDICIRTAQAAIQDWIEYEGFRTYRVSEGIRNEFDIWKLGEIIPFDDGPETHEHDDESRCSTCGMNL